jgi:hypothetical protein
VAVRHSRAVQRLSSATRPTESRLGRIGPISLDVKQMGERSAGNPHAAFDAEGAGNVAGSKCFDPSRRASPRPYLCGGRPVMGVPTAIASSDYAGVGVLRSTWAVLTLRRRDPDWNATKRRRGSERSGGFSFLPSRA